MVEWVPATEAEVAMRDTLRAGDQEGYFQVLGGIELLLPVSADALAGRAPMGWGTWTSGERTHVLAFTSSQAMAACLAGHAGSARRVPYHELAENWPNVDWWLAVNPGLPIEGYLPAWFVSQLARGDVRLPGRPTETRARIERIESFQRTRAVASVPSAQPAPAAAIDVGLSTSRNVDHPRVDRPTSMPKGAGQAPPAPPPPPPPPPAAAPPLPPARTPAFVPGPARGSAPPLPTRVPSIPPPSGVATLGPQGPASPRGPASPQGLVDPPRSVGPQPSSRPSQTAAPAREPARASAPVPAPIRPAPDFDPANDVEESLLTAAEDGNTDAFLSTLLLAKVLIRVPPSTRPGAGPGDADFPWLTETVDDQPYVVAFTSAERLHDHAGPGTDPVSVKFVQLIRHWPDDQWSFAVNPGTPVGAKLPGTQIVALASWADEVGLGGETAADEPTPAPAPRPSAAAPAPAPAGPTMMQKAVPPDHVDYYLERGFDLVSGFVHRAAEVAHLRTPTELFTALGLNYAGSPFTRDATELYVLRWAAHRPNLYRIPYGGQHEAGMRAMQGWVIERGPFRGNGFAPGDTGDIIAEFKVDSVGLPHGAQLWRVSANGGEVLVAMLDADGPQWRRVGAES